MPRTFTDQLSRVISIDSTPRRIISLVPSQTELLFDLGLNDSIIGITKFCNHPSRLVNTKAIIGGTKHLRMDLIRDLKPDLIIGNKEENERGNIETLMQEFPVWMSDINNLAQALEMIRNIGQITDTESKAEAIALNIENEFALLPTISKPIRVAYLIWQGPYMAAGKSTFIDDMLQRCGFINVFEQMRYPEFGIEDMVKAEPDVILLSTEPYPFKQKHIEAFKLIMPGKKVLLVDGEMFSWYGSRLLLAAKYFKQLITSLNLSVTI